MKCAHHPDQDATATCQNCGRAMCYFCTNRFNAVVCEGCVIHGNDLLISKQTFNIAVTVLLFLVTFVGFAYMFSQSEMRGPGIGEAIIFAFVISMTLWSWKFLSANQHFTLFGNAKFWLNYLLLKCCLSVALAPFIGPYNLYIAIKETKAAKRTNQQITNNEI